MKHPELSKLLALLKDAPSTVAECSALLGLGLRRVQVGMWQLTHAGLVISDRSIPNPEVGRGHTKMRKLYRLIDSPCRVS
jgi:predicted transcriptional regulator